ncbi:hypothetical protein G7Y79_00080g100600 [Physcia stellaris]|nr:hypothetical protein G7Y79_00080g100600 [Physcia stellaris]
MGVRSWSSFIAKARSFYHFLGLCEELTLREGSPVLAEFKIDFLISGDTSSTKLERSLAGDLPTTPDQTPVDDEVNEESRFYGTPSQDDAKEHQASKREGSICSCLFSQRAIIGHLSTSAAICAGAVWLRIFGPLAHQLHFLGRVSAFRTELARWHVNFSARFVSGLRTAQACWQVNFSARVVSGRRTAQACWQVNFSAWGCVSLFKRSNGSSLLEWRTMVVCLGLAVLDFIGGWGRREGGLWVFGTGTVVSEATPAEDA